jgi:hypothetical protein
LCVRTVDNGGIALHYGKLMNTTMQNDWSHYEILPAMCQASGGSAN